MLSTPFGQGTFRLFYASSSKQNKHARAHTHTHTHTHTHRCYELPIDNYGISEYRIRPDPLRALSAAQKMKALCTAMEATPSVWVDSWHVDYMLWCVRACCLLVPGIMFAYRRVMLEC